MARASSVVSARAMAPGSLTQQRNRTKLADSCSATVAGFYAAVDKCSFAVGWQLFVKGLVRDVRGQAEREPIDASTQRWQADLRDMVFGDQPADRRIGLPQRLSFISCAVQISRRNSVDHILGRKIEGRCDNSFSRCDPSDQTASFLKLRSGCMVYGTTDPTACKQTGVRRVDDSLCCDRRNVPEFGGDHVIENLACSSRLKTFIR